MIQEEVITSSINSNISITDIHISTKRKQIKISQYPDDSNLFLKKQESVTNVLKFFEILKKAAATTINLKKLQLFRLTQMKKHKSKKMLQKLQSKNNSILNY